MSEKEVCIRTSVDQTDYWGSTRSPGQNLASSSKRVVNIIDEISHFDKKCHILRAFGFTEEALIFLAYILIMLPRYIKSICGKINKEKKFKFSK